jgi:hypothetical protein
MIQRAALAFLLGLLAPALAWGGSTINTTLPANGPYNAAPIRQNFGAAANDINALASLNAGASAPSAPSNGAFWLNTPNSGTTYTLNVWIASAHSWVPIARIDAAAGLWMPPTGGGALPSLVSAATTDLGSVPQTALYITGAQTIASFGSSTPVGVMKVLIFTGGAVLRNNNTSLILPGAANLTPGPGGILTAISLGGGNWRVAASAESGAGGTPPSFAPGVVCDGITDTTAALQAVANAVTVGQLIFLPPGICKVSATITWRKGVIVSGAGMPGMNTSADLTTTGLRGTIISTGAATGDVFSFPIEDRAVVRDMMFDYTGGGTRASGAYLGWVGNFTGPGLGTYIRQPEADNVMFRYGYDDIRCDFCFAPRVFNTYNLDFAHAGVYIVQNSTGADYGDGVFENNEFWELDITPGTCQAGILALATGLMKVDGNKFNGCRRGVDLELTYGPTGTMIVRGNSFENSTDRAIYLNQAASGIDYGNVVIADNEFLSFGTQFPANGLIGVASGTASSADVVNWIQKIDIHDNLLNAPYTSAAALIHLQDGGNVLVHHNICDVAYASGGPPCATVGGNAGGVDSGERQLVVIDSNQASRYGGNAFYGAIKDGTVIHDLVYQGPNPLGLKPTLASCGTGTPTVTGTDQVFQVNVDTGSPTSCQVLFAVKKPLSPLCTITGLGTGMTTFSYTVDAIAGTVYPSITVTALAGLASGGFVGRCDP